MFSKGYGTSEINLLRKPKICVLKMLWVEYELSEDCIKRFLDKKVTFQYDLRRSVNVQKVFLELLLQLYEMLVHYCNG